MSNLIIRYAPKEIYGDIRNWTIDKLKNIIEKWEDHDVRLVAGVLAELERRKEVK